MLLALMLLVAGLAIPGPVQAGNHDNGEDDSSKPCIGFQVMPPTVHADPHCVLFERRDKAGFNVSAVIQGPHVVVTWQFETEATVEQYILYRGEDPDLLRPFDSTENNTTTYEDEWALVVSHSTYYAVGAEITTDDGERKIVRSQSEMIEAKA